MSKYAVLWICTYYYTSRLGHALMKRLIAPITEDPADQVRAPVAPNSTPTAVRCHPAVRRGTVFIRDAHALHAVRVGHMGLLPPARVWATAACTAVSGRTGRADCAVVLSCCWLIPIGALEAVRRPREDRARLICGCREITPAQREFSEHRPQSIVPSQLPANRPHIAPSSSQVDGTHWHKMFEGIAGTVRPGHAKQPPRGFSAVHALAHAPQSIVPPQRSEIGPHCLAASRQPSSASK